MAIDPTNTAKSIEDADKEEYAQLNPAPDAGHHRDAIENIFPIDKVIQSTPTSRDVSARGPIAAGPTSGTPK